MLDRIASMALVSLAMLGAACSENSADLKADAGGADAASHDAATLTGDEAIFQSVLDGTLPAADGLARVAELGGWPIVTANGFLFARLDDGAGPYRLAGDFNGWNAAELELTSGVYWTRIAIAAPDAAKYKLVGPDGAFSPDPLARRYGHDGFGEFSLVAASAPHLERFPNVGQGSLPARSVRIWVPASTPLAHLYVHDGQNLFDPAAPFGGWKLSESVSTTTLVVGIDNAGAERMNEYTHVPDLIDGTTVGGNADAYAAFVKDVVRPLVEQRYGVVSNVGVMGSSLGGLVAFHQVLRDPGAWHFAAALSGTFGWGSIGAENETLIARFASAGKLDVALYLDSGGGPGSGCVDADADGTEDDSADAKDNYCETEQLKQTLEALGWQHGADLQHWWEAGATHDEAAWAARVWRPVQQLEALSSR